MTNELPTAQDLLVEADSRWESNLDDYATPEDKRAFTAQATTLECAAALVAAIDRNTEALKDVQRELENHRFQDDS